MDISSSFDGGNIICIDGSNPNDIRLEIAKDHQSDFYQWFYFRLTGARDVPVTLRITNAGGAAYARGWQGYRAVASTDRKSWFRAPTSYDGQNLVISHTPERDVVYYAYFAPYSMERHHDQIARQVATGRVRHSALGQTLDGQPIDYLQLGEPDATKHPIWIIARQHPGETMAEWFMEGLLNRLNDPDDALARQLLARAVFHLVPNMNPDGSRRGHLRTNAAGVNLNREWQAPSLDKSPEVYHVQARMAATGVDFCLDVHGDEVLPYNFIAGPNGIPGITPRQLDLLERYKAALRQADPDFQTAHGYPIEAPGRANMTLCTSHVAQNFGCLAMTLEQPFKDTADTPDEIFGWSPGRAMKLGASQLDAIAAVIDDLR